MSPGGMELVSPKFDVRPHSAWRENVQATWDYLQQNYSIESNDLCGTHIHVSLIPVFELSDLQRIACAVIHFETAFEALMPPERRVTCGPAGLFVTTPCGRPCVDTVAGRLIEGSRVSPEDFSSFALNVELSAPLSVCPSCCNLAELLRGES